MGLAVAGLIAWAVNGTLSEAPAVRSASAATETGQAGGSMPGHRAHRHRATGRHARPGHRAVGLVRARRHGLASDAASDRRTGRASRRRSAWRVAACPPGDVVLSLHQPRAACSGCAWPRFEADVVSAAAAPCTFSTGPRFVSVVVRAGSYLATAVSGRLISTPLVFVLRVPG